MVADLREDAEDYQEAIRTALYGHTAKMQTGMPGIVVSYNPASQTAIVQPAIQAINTSPDGTKTPVSIAPIPDVPVQFPSGGGVTLTFPVAAGDECWLSFSSRAIDGWFQNGGTAPPPHPRQHDLSDAVAHLGFRSQKNVLAGVSATSTQLRTNDGSTYVEVTSAGQLVNIVAPMGITITGPVKIAGTLAVTEEVTAFVGTGASVTLSKHKGHTAGGTQPPTPGT